MNENNYQRQKTQKTDRLTSIPDNSWIHLYPFIKIKPFIDKNMLHDVPPWVGLSMNQIPQHLEQEIECHSPPSFVSDAREFCSATQHCIHSRHHVQKRNMCARTSFVKSCTWGAIWHTSWCVFLGKKRQLQECYLIKYRGS